MDSDDYFKKDKLKSIIKTFQKEKKQKIIFDLPIMRYKNISIKKSFKQKKFLSSNWPRFSPQSCISVRKEYADELFDNLKVKKFDKIWFDFRIAAYTFLKCNKIFIHNKYLTYYRQHKSSESQKFKSFTKNWWIRRNQAHDFIKYLSKKKRFKKKFSIDEVITKIVNLFIYD